MRFLGRALCGQARAAGNAGVRGVHVADHFHDQVVQFFGVGDVGEQGLVRILGRGPVHAVHFGIVEAVLHDAPGFLENLAAFGGDIDLHLHGEGDAARCRLRRTRCRWLAPRLRSCLRVLRVHRVRRRLPTHRRPLRRAALDGQRVDAAALQEVDAAAVARPLGLAAAAESAAPAASATAPPAVASATVVFKRVRRVPSSSMVYMPGPPPAPAASSVPPPMAENR